MAVSKETRKTFKTAKRDAADRREIEKQQQSPYKRMVKMARHKKGFVTPPQYEPSANTRG